MDSFKVGEFVVIRVDTDAEKEASIATVNNLVIPELSNNTHTRSTFESELRRHRCTHLDEVRLILLVPRRD